MTEYQPCYVENDRVAPCSSLLQAVDDRAIRILTLADMETGDVTRSLAVLHAGNYKQTGIVMNHCPFCGEKLHSVDPETEEP